MVWVAIPEVALPSWHHRRARTHQLLWGSYLLPSFTMLRARQKSLTPVEIDLEGAIEKGGGKPHEGLLSRRRGLGSPFVCYVPHCTQLSLLYFLAQALGGPTRLLKAPHPGKLLVGPHRSSKQER